MILGTNQLALLRRAYLKGFITPYEVIIYYNFTGKNKTEKALAVLDKLEIQGFLTYEDNKWKITEKGKRTVLEREIGGCEKMKRGRPVGSKKTRALLLDYRSWVIYYEDGNYVLKKKDKNKGIAYHSTLENALQDLYDQMLLYNVNEKNGYGAKFNDLKNLILETKQELSDLLSINSILEKSYKGEKNETH